MDRNHDFMTFFQKRRRPGVGNFSDIIEVATIFIETTFKGTQIKLKFHSYLPKKLCYLLH